MKATQIYEEVTAAMIDLIESGRASADDWVRPWAGGGLILDHRNATTGKRYQGFNILALAVAGIEHNYDEGKWATYKQWQAAERQVAKGQHATYCVKWVEKKHEHPQGFNFCSQCGEGFPVGFAVFNIGQLEDYVAATPSEPPDPGRVFDGIDSLVAGAERDGLTIRHIDQGSAYYEASRDTITLPTIARFRTAAGYYATTLHEMSHATGHPKRLNREYGKRFGDDKYAMEELTAELSAAFLGTSLGIIDDGERVQHGSYLASWLRVLRDDAKALAHIAAKAQAAATYWEERAVTAASTAA